MTTKVAVGDKKPLRAGSLLLQGAASNTDLTPTRVSSREDGSDKRQVGNTMQTTLWQTLSRLMRSSMTCPLRATGYGSLT